MEPLESPRVEQVGGILSRGEDTDGERTDDEVDFPSASSSYVSQYQAEQDEGEQQDELEVTGEGTAGGPFGLKKVLFVRKKSEKGAGSKEALFASNVSKTLDAQLQEVGGGKEPSFKDRFSKIGAGVGERFAAFGNIIQEHGSKNTAASGTAPKVAESVPAAEGPIVKSQVPPQGAAAAAAAASSRDPPQQLAMEYFQEYEMTFSSKPKFSLVEGPDGKGAVVSWDSFDAAGVNGGGGAAAAPATTPGGRAGAGKASVPGNVPPSGAVVIAVAGKSVVDRNLSEVVALLEEGGGSGSGDADGDNKNDRREEEEQSKATANKGIEEPEKLSIEVPPDSAGGGGGGGDAFLMVVRFREKAGPGGVRQHEAAGGEVFRNRMKAMATGLGNLFQVKENGGSVVRDGSVSGSDAGGAASAAAAASDAFVLTFSAGSGTAEELPFTMAEVVGGLGVIVAAVRDDYVESLVKPEEAGVVSAGTAGVVAAAAAAAAAAPGDEGVSGQGGANGGVGKLEPGALLLRVAGQNVEGKGLQRVRKVVEAVAAEHSAVKILFRHAPPIYRASVAAELALEQSKAPQVHVGTWQPLLKRRAGVTLGGGGGGNGDGDNGDGGGGGGGVIGLGYGGEEWEDVQTTMARAHRFVNGFRSVGIRVDILSMQTVTLPRNVKSAYATTFEGRPSTFQQAVRLWFSFPDERTVSLQRQPTLEKLGLLHVDTRGVGTIGSWVAVTAADASPCADAGVPAGENSILTHVNGFDVSPAAYRSLAPLPFGEGQGWAAAVLPALESGGGDRITLTFV